MAVAALGMSRAVAAAPSERARRGDKEMPKIEIAKIQAQQIASYPKEFAPVISGREKQKIGDAAGLTQFGVNITRIKPGSASALRHWHEQEDEFIYLLEGELILQEEAGETVLKGGDAAGFKAGSGVAHCLVNRSGHDAVYLEIGTRADSERVHYPDVDFMMERDSTGRRYFRKSGEPISD
jgi:Uncharacterized conserved protein, contains double-stranded beta-helix domain